LSGAVALSSARVVCPDRVGPGTLVIEDGRIAAITARHARGPGVLDCGELAISPGLFDAHVHVNEPGRTAWEGFATATRAAAAGGVTSLVDMPLNCTPVTTTADALDQKLAAARGQLHVDVGFWGGVIPGNAGHLAGLARGGVLGCKAFLVHSGIDEFPNASADDLRAAMPELARQGLPLLAHAELDLGAEGEGAGGDPRAYRSYLASRPAAWEDAAIALLIALCRETGCAVHIVHLSAASSIPQLRAAKAEGLPITVETCPHYLCLEAEAIPDGATQFKCAPPIRAHANREALWQALFDGVIDCVISDHSPCTPELKGRERGDFAAAWGGIASLSLALPAIWSEARARGAALTDLARWLSEGPARLAGWSARKGRIAVGCDADLVVWDPEASFAVTPERLFFRHKLSPYLGTTLRGRVARCFLRGEEIFDGEQPGAAARGRMLLHRPDAAEGAA
jgi:allantoinase